MSTPDLFSAHKKRQFRVGEPAARLLVDALTMTREQIRARWKAGEYGGDGIKPRPEHVDGWLKMMGK